MMQKNLYIFAVMHLGKNTDQEGQKLGQASIKTKYQPPNSRAYSLLRGE